MCHNVSGTGASSVIRIISYYLFQCVSEELRQREKLKADDKFISLNNETCKEHFSTVEANARKMDWNINDNANGTGSKCQLPVDECTEAKGPYYSLTVLNPSNGAREDSNGENEKNER